MRQRGPRPHPNHYPHHHLYYGGRAMNSTVHRDPWFHAWSQKQHLPGAQYYTASSLCASERAPLEVLPLLERCVDRNIMMGCHILSCRSYQTRLAVAVGGTAGPYGIWGSKAAFGLELLLPPCSCQPGGAVQRSGQYACSSSQQSAVCLQQHTAMGSMLAAVAAT